MKILIDLLHFIQPYGTHSYFVILAVLLACGFGLPLPEDITLVAAGILAARDIIDFNFTVALCMFGVLLGDGIIFYLGSRYGTKLRSSKFFSVILPERRDAAVKAIFQKYGDKVIDRLLIALVDNHRPESISTFPEPLLSYPAILRTVLYLEVLV